jgi:aspartate/glutamate racemase
LTVGDRHGFKEDMTRIALIHALRHSPPPIEQAFRRHWPEARLVNILEDSLSADLAEQGHFTDAMTNRFLRLADYAVDTGAQGILFTCSAFGPCIDAVKVRHAGMPVLKPNEAMVEEAERRPGRIGLLATFAPTLKSMPPEFKRPDRIQLCHAKDALEALEQGNGEQHDQLAAEAAAAELMTCDVIALAQFSLARAARAVAAATGKPVLTTPDSAVLKLKSLLG